MKKTILLLINLLIINQLSFSQSVTIVPINPLNPTAGTLDYNNTTNQLQYWNSTAWIPITNVGSGNGWALSGNDIKNINSGNVGIGISSPGSLLHVVSNIENNYTLPAPFAYTSNNAGTFVTNNTVFNASPNVGVMGASVGTGTIGTGQKTSFNIGVAGIGNAGTNAVGVYGSASAGSNNYGVYCNGSGGYTGTWTLLSDIRFKEKITTLDDDILSKIMQLKPANYTLKTEEFKQMNFPKTRQFGFIAQDLEQVFPTLVEKTTSMNIGNSQNENKTEPIEYKVVNYIGMIPILTKAIQEQQKIITQLRKELETKNYQIEEEIAGIKTMIQGKNKKMATRNQKQIDLKKDAFLSLK